MTFVELSSILAEWSAVIIAGLAAYWTIKLTDMGKQKEMKENARAKLYILLRELEKDDLGEFPKWKETAQKSKEKKGTEFIDSIEGTLNQRIRKT